ncbi:uncharacterized protein LOC131632877 [Vicia villosa]|uniref:uncharacterized protein LOC131632877 n=1 Tax=Vicia villosa TaxID=3911 RepID=UPI00273B5E9B|nr:uncharacterized protein LOC131632877 [Vicia villosa]
MGNCLKGQSSTKYATDDEVEWDYPASKGDYVAEKIGVPGAKTMTEVKIKITKKQLEELLRKVDVRELKVDQVLAQLVSHSNGYKSFERSWRPALQSIPEMD